MVKYLSKFMLEVLPSVVATVVGAYIVAHYINPKPERPKTEVVATAPTGEAKDATDTTGTVEDKATDAKPADAKAAEAKAADAKPAEAGKVEAAKVEVAKVKVARPDEKKNAIELARAAIERLRGTTVDAPPAAVPQPVRASAETARADDGARVRRSDAGAPTYLGCDSGRYYRPCAAACTCHVRSSAAAAAGDRGVAIWPSLGRPRGPCFDCAGRTAGRSACGPGERRPSDPARGYSVPARLRSAGASRAGRARLDRRSRAVDNEIDLPGVDAERPVQLIALSQKTKARTE